MNGDDQMLCHLYKVFFDDVPACGCNEPQAAFELVHQILRLAPFYDGTYKDVRELIGSAGAFQIILCALTEANLIEHGGTIGGSWLTGKGRWVLWAVDQAGGIEGLDEKLDAVGFPHEWDREAQQMQPCIDACWAVPEGWEPVPVVVPVVEAPATAEPCPGPSCPQYLYGAVHEHNGVGR